jgi:DinB superfamily
MKATPAQIEEVLQTLAETPRRIAVATETTAAEQLMYRPDAKSWSANDILAHLRACADVWGETIEAMLQEDEPTLKHISPRTYIRKTCYPELPFQDSFQAFVGQRDDLLQTLGGLEFAGWSRGALIKDRRHTVFTQARRLALHEATHIEQLEALPRHS